MRYPGAPKFGVGN